MYVLSLYTVVNHTLCMLIRQNRDKTALFKILTNKIFLKLSKNLIQIKINSSFLA